MMEVVSYLYKICRKIDSVIFGKTRSWWVSNAFCSCGRGFYAEQNISVVGGEFISLGKNCIVHQQTDIYAFREVHGQKFTPRIVIGNDCNIGRNNKLTATNGIYLGNGVLTGGYVTIVDNNHGDIVAELMDIAPDSRRIVSKGPIEIGDNVWIGEKATILPGVKIGKGSVIAANAVVAHDVPAYSVAAGVPAKIIKTLK